jgi:hypothetical protein
MMKKNTKINDYFAAKCRKSESSGIIDDVHGILFVFHFTSRNWRYVLTVHNLVEIWSRTPGIHASLKSSGPELCSDACIPSKFNEINLLTRGLDMVPWNKMHWKSCSLTQNSLNVNGYLWTISFMILIVAWFHVFYKWTIPSV